MLRLSHRVILARVERPGQAQPPGQFRRQIGQDIAKHVGGDDHVVAVGVAHQMRGQRGASSRLRPGAVRETRSKESSIRIEVIADCEPACKIFR